jgi:hypothetical protein
MKLTYAALAAPLAILICLNTAFQKKAISSTNKNHKVKIETPSETSSETVSFAKQSQNIDQRNDLRPIQHFIADQYYGGIWDSTEGQMTFEESGGFVNGTYNKRGGVLYSTLLASNVMSGYWVQNYSNRRCSNSVGGSYYWGRFRLVFSNNSFEGVYNYCSDPSNYRWTGRRS